jgi:hypothetical protein
MSGLAGALALMLRALAGRYGVACPASPAKRSAGLAVRIVLSIDTWPVW